MYTRTHARTHALSLTHTHKTRVRARGRRHRLGEGSLRGVASHAGGRAGGVTRLGNPAGQGLREEGGGRGRKGGTGRGRGRVQGQRQTMEGEREGGAGVGRGMGEREGVEGVSQNVNSFRSCPYEGQAWSRHGDEGGRASGVAERTARSHARSRPPPRARATARTCRRAARAQKHAVVAQAGAEGNGPEGYANARARAAVEFKPSQQS